ncbi:MAG: TauD/TfdA family dioxygenase [Hyphomicrobiales bacterium]|nr:TauD/TfdA family dioxygenase [Hyphomicrobiales bacterium]MBV9974118.1 TauD/TfdA family dioxygenase [Hyphomicrobiales bacterium]
MNKGSKSSFEVRPTAGSLGAEVRGVDLAGPLSGSTADELRRALVKHVVLFFRDQKLTPVQHLAFSRLFGSLLRVPYVKHMDEHPDIIAVLKEADERKISAFGNAWHSDFSFLEAPPMGSVLYAREVPSHGGDTLWSNMYDAYEALSDGMKRMLDPLRAMHSGRPYGVAHAPKGVQTSRSIAIERGNRDADREIAHPVVIVHPSSGRKALFVNAIYTTRFEQMTEAESRPLLEFLFEHCIRPEFTCRFRWAPGSLAIWDNRCTLHYAVNDYDGSRRLMHRTTIAGEPLVGAV